MRIVISLATNDEHGQDTGRVYAIQIEDAIDLQWGERGTEPKYSIDGGLLKLSRRRFPLWGKRDWYGNWCWTGVVTDLCWAARLLNYVSQDDRWHCEGGWCDLTDAFSEGKVTPAMLTELGERSATTK
jgi:hypothetical protein